MNREGGFTAFTTAQKAKKGWNAQVSLFSPSFFDFFAVVVIDILLPVLTPLRTI
jgi:hypothetical protein